ncbi:hypothetical protein [Vibrio sp. McD22-P3]|uniref:hypothetical protein n=1 Tax=Vibrio sp. McD22-P3 TaxID=2724880 RepID=UPI001F1D038F|nr:hypothetical protein [Vibrio sp. McD22-P3]MCF4174326.1 hypothetical protein [Vibrio sp. McD22-P3]
MLLNIKEKHSDYYSAETTSGQHCKIFINTTSHQLQLGKQFLNVEDLEGTDIQLTVSIKDESKQRRVTLKADKNSLLISDCKRLGGTWDKELAAWTFPNFVASEVRQLDELYNSQPATIELTAKEEIREYGSDIEFAGLQLCRAFGRDPGARIHADVALISGYATSAGSVENWATILDEGAVLRLQIPSKLLEVHQDDRFDIKIID